MFSNYQVSYNNAQRFTTGASPQTYTTPTTQDMIYVGFGMAFLILPLLWAIAAEYSHYRHQVQLQLQRERLERIWQMSYKKVDG
jgi:hypothetical protein